jgi:glucosamine kinase
MSHTATRLVLGIDGGGTHSLAVAVDSTGKVRAFARAGSLNFLGSDLPTARGSLKNLVAELRRRLPPGTQFRKVVAGCAALFSDATNAERERLCRGILPLERTRVVSDCQTAFFGATLGQSGLVVIAGTGSIVLALNQSGQFTRVGGWGHLLGDAGSAYWIALESVKAAIAAEEGLGPRTGLTMAVRRWFGVGSLAEIVPIIHQPGFAKDDFAALSGEMARKIGRRDAVFRGICRRAGQELAAQALAAADLARMKARPLPVFPVGSVLTNNALVCASLIAALKEACAVRVAKPRLSPTLGAAAMALVEAGVELTPEMVAMLAGHTHQTVG